MDPLILQSDFGYADGAVSAMYGVAESVCPGLRVYDLTHDIPQYDIWEASYRLIQTVNYWPAAPFPLNRWGLRCRPTACWSCRWWSPPTKRT